MNLDEATKYLKSVGEWETVLKLDREVIIKWAEYLESRERQTEKPVKKTSKKTLVETLS